MNIIKSPSPNFYGRQGYKPELIVVHITDGYFPSDLAWLRNPNPPPPAGPVSSHDLIAPNGDVHELVDWQNGAWHAGRVLNPTAKLKKNLWGGYINPNYYSYGIEVSCKPPSVPTPAQIENLKARIKDRLALFGLPTDRDHVIGHKEIYSGKTCPGPIDIDQLVIKMVAPAVDRVAIVKQIKDLADKLI
jgi:N-acetyl-anhydromuramyl-L-alanine amidase AmpD